MASQENAKGGRDKELSAMMFNLKEQRVLEKCLQTLQLQQTYSMKILDIGNREIKVHYKKLKDKVSKIKSHLTVEDISKFRELEMQGKISSLSDSMVTSSSIKMAAASRRLNLLSDRSTRKRVIRSALPRISIQSDNSDIRVKSFDYSPNSAAINSISRSKSLMDPQEPIFHSSQLIINPQQSCEPKRQNFILENYNEKIVSDKEIVSPGTMVKHDSLIVPEPHSTMQTGSKNGNNFRSHSAAYSHSHLPFSSHVAAAKDARTELISTIPAQYHNMRRLSLVSHDSIDSNLGENLFEERRLEMLEEENLKAALLDRKTQDFLRKVDDYLQRKPRLKSTQAVTGIPLPEPAPENSQSYSSKGNNRYQRFQRRDLSSEFDQTPTFFPEQEYKERLTTLWKDMNKCRYLRLPDDQMDLTGINTLAKEHMQLF